MVTPARGALHDRNSLSWRFNSQSFVLLGGPRAAILQVCDPGVAAGVAEFSSYRTDPFGRLERTLESMLAIGFGSPERRREVLDRLERIHSAVQGQLDDGTPYSALDPQRQYWVVATLTDTVIEVDRRYLGYMKRRHRAAYFEESKAVANAFGIPDRLVPDDYDEFREYFSDMVATLVPSEQSREVAETLIHPRVRYVPGFAWLPFSAVTAELLPTRIRRELGVRDLNRAELAAVRGAQLSMRNSLAHLASGAVANPLNARAIRSAA